MIIFLYGQDTYGSKRKLQEIVEHYKEIHKSGLNLKFFDAAGLAYQEFKDVFSQVSMFREKKMIILRGASLNQEFQASFLENMQNFVDSQDIILFYEEEISQDNFFKSLKKNAKTQEFQLLTGQKLKSWVKKEFDLHQTKIALPVIELLIKHVGNDLWQMSQEIEKLVAFKNLPAGRQGKNEVVLNDIKLLVRPKIDNDIFKTIDALAQKNKKQALSLLHGHLEEGDSPLYLLSMINFQFRNLLMVKTSQNLKMHPYVIKKSAWQARMFTLEELKKIYSKLFEADYKIKTGKIDSQTALDLLITEI